MNKYLNGLNRIQLLTFSVSIIAVITSIVSIVWSSIDLKIDFKITEISLGVVSSFIGLGLGIFAHRMTFGRNTISSHKVFLSHSRNDYDITDKIRKELSKERFLLNKDYKDILVGENVAALAKEEIITSSIMIVLLTKNSGNSDNQAFEIESALKEGIKILPVLIHFEAEIPLELQNFKYADLTQDFNRGINSLIYSLKLNLADISLNTRRK